MCSMQTLTIGILGQAVGYYKTARTASDHDIVVF